MSERSQIVKEIDACHRNIIHALDHECVTCGSTTGLECSHLISKGSSGLSLRWDTHPDGNCHLQCRECHNEHHTRSSERYRDWFIDHNGEAAYRDLKRRAARNKFLFNHELVDILVDLNEVMDELHLLH